MEEQSFLDRIAEAGAPGAEAPAPDELARVTILAQKQLRLLGEGITKGPTGDAIQGLRDWAKKQGVQEAAGLADYSIAELIGALVVRLSEYRKISEIDLPAAMSAVGGVGLSEFKLANGYTVCISKDVRASVKANVWNDLLPWLDDKGLGDIVNDEIKFNLDRNDEKFFTNDVLGDHLLSSAKMLGIVPQDAETMTKGEAILTFSRGFCNTIGEEKLSINAATLKATVKEQRGKGVEFPNELFSIMDFEKALVEPPKTKKIKAK